MPMIDTLKSLLGPNVIEEAAQFCLDDAQQIALDYCNLEEIPAGLQSTVIRMAVDLYRLEGYGQAAAPKGPAIGLKEGDQSVSFATDRATAIAGRGAILLTDYAVRLNAFRKLRW